MKKQFDVIVVGAGNGGLTAAANTAKAGLKTLLLEKHNITIPDVDRTGDESEARLYGCTYYDLEEEVVSILNELVKKIKKLSNAEIDIYNL